MERLWCDKHKPMSLHELSYNQQLTCILKKVAGQKDFPHLLFYGQSGAGKKTRAMCFLNEIFGSSVYKLRAEERQVEGTSSKIDFTVVFSSHHSDLTPADVGNQDKLVINRHIKQTAETGCVGGASFKVIVINQADRLSKEAQAGLRRTMEQCVGRCRLILLCQNLSRIIDPLRSRCLMLRVKAPEQQKIATTLAKVCQAEQVPYVQQCLLNLSRNSEGNLRWALLQLQVESNRGKLVNPQRQLKSEWKAELQKVASQLLTNQSVQKMVSIRASLYDFLQNCIPPQLVIRTLMDCVLREVRGERARVQASKAAALCEWKMQQGSKPILHLEHFCARVMHIVKSNPV